MRGSKTTVLNRKLSNIFAINTARSEVPTEQFGTEIPVLSKQGQLCLIHVNKGACVSINSIVD